jgi:hypothetical protein
MSGFFPWLKEQQPTVGEPVPLPAAPDASAAGEDDAGLWLTWLDGWDASPTGDGDGDGDG